jgi:hypothetical protein
MSSEDIASGITKGVLDWSADLVKSLAEKFRDRKLAFIQDNETIKLVREQYNSGELNFYKNYIPDTAILFLVKLGLTLRRLEGNLDRRANLRDKIFKKYELRGLHIAQFVENGILSRYTAILIDNLISIEDLKNKIANTLNDIEKYVLFVQARESDREVVELTRTKVFANSPDIFVISGISPASEIVKRCEGTITKLLTDYELERFSSGRKENLFYKRILK